MYQHPFLLVVEDCTTDFGLLFAELRRQEFLAPVVRVGNGVEALEFLQCVGRYEKRQPVNPRLMLVDIRMPLMNGLEFLRLMKASDEIGQIPVVILTGSDFGSDLEEAQTLGALGIVSKPTLARRFADTATTIIAYWEAVSHQQPIDTLQHTEPIEQH